MSCMWYAVCLDVIFEVKYACFAQLKYWCETGFSHHFHVKLYRFPHFAQSKGAWLNYGRPENDGDLQDDFMNVCSTEFKKIRIKAWYPQYPLSYRRWTGAWVVLVYVISTMTLQSKKWKMLCRKKLMGHGDISATRGRLSPRWSPDGLARKALPNIICSTQVPMWHYGKPRYRILFLQSQPSESKN